MALNYIFVAFFLISFLVGIIKVTGHYMGFDMGEGAEMVFLNMINSTFDRSKVGFEISIGLTGVLTLWMGIMKIGEKGGAIAVLSKLVNPLFRKLFPEIPKDHPASGNMMMNFSANMLGLDNAATPLGLKAMDELQTLNSKKDTASNAQIMFLVLNTSGLTIVPVSVMAIRAANHASNPSDVFIPILIATYFASLVGLISVSIIQKINLFNKVVLAYLGSITLALTGFVYYLSTLNTEQVSKVSGFAAGFILFSIIISFLALAMRAKVNIYEAFIEGAKDGFNVAIKIVPYLVAMLVAIGVFTTSGAMQYLLDAIGFVIVALGGNPEIVEALPTAMMKPLSGSGARGMMVEAMQTHGSDSFIGRLAGTFQGSTETTFYTIAVYFGAVNIKKTRYTVTCGLLADLAGIIAAIIVAQIFFG